MQDSEIRRNKDDIPVNCKSKVERNDINTLAKCKAEADRRLKKLKSDIEISLITSDEVKANESLLLSTSEDVMYGWNLSKKIVSEWNKKVLGEDGYSSEDDPHSKNQDPITKIEQLLLTDVLVVLKQFKKTKPDDKKIPNIIRGLKNSLQTITSPQFAIVYNRVQQEFSGDVSHIDVYEIQKENPKLLVNTEFWEFSQQMCVDFEVERTSLYIDVGLYKKLSNNTELQQSLKENYALAKQYFPSIPQTTVFLNNLLKNIDTPINWARLKQNFDRLQTVYGQNIMQINLEYDWNILFKNLAKEDKIELLTSDLAIEVWEVIKKYPKLVKSVGKNINDMFREYSDMKQYIEFFQVLDISPSKFEYLLQLCGLNLTSKGVSLYKSSIENIPKNVDKLLANNEFQKSTEELFTELPQLKENLNFYDWVDIIESFLENGNLDYILKINQLYQQVNIVGIDLRAKDADSKIAILEQLINLEIPLDQFNFTCNETNPDKCSIGHSTSRSPYLVDAGNSLTSPEISEVVNHKDFYSFAKKVESYFPQVNWETHIPDIALLFSYIQKNPKHVELLFSEDFQKFCNLLVTEFEFVQSKGLRNEKINQIPIGAIRKLLPIIEDFPFDEFKKISTTLKAKGEKLVANDILLILEMTKYPDLLETITDNRQQTVSNITNNLGDGVRRTIFGDIGFRIEEAKKNGDPKEIAKTQAVLDSYNERPDIETLPDLDILRIKLIQEGLSNKTFLQNLGITTTNDLADNPALEHGGLITLDKQKTKFQEISTIYKIKKSDNFENADASYNSNNYEPMHGGLVHFHLHALSPNQKGLAGPSGYKGIGGDFSVAKYKNAPGVVFTPVGYPKDSTGNDITNKIKMDVDYFFTDERNGGCKQIVVDLGIVEVSLEIKK